MYGGRFNCHGSEYRLSDCPLSPPSDASCAADPSRAVGFSCIRGIHMHMYIGLNVTQLLISEAVNCFKYVRGMFY